MKWALTAREVGVALSVSLYVACVAGVGYGIFEGGGHLEHTLWLIIVGQTIFLIALALRAPRWLGAILSGIGLLITLSHQHAPASHWYGLPTMRTWEIWYQAAAESAAEFNIATAPVPYEAGWDGLFGLGVALVVISTLIFGQVLHAHFEALIPGATFFIFLSVLGEAPNQLLLTLAVITSGYVMAATLRGSAHLTVARLTAVGVTIAVIATGVAPYLPGAEQDPWITTRGRFGATDTALSPLVDIQARLVNQSMVEMFVMESAQPAYWRVLTLSEFDGRRFSAPNSPRETTGPSELDLALSAAGVAAPRQEHVLRISSLEGSLIPAAAVPVAVSAQPTLRDSQPAVLQWNPQISAVVRSDRDLQPDDTFFLETVITQFQTTELLTLRADTPPDSIYRSLPESFPQSVIDQAAAVVAAATGLTSPDAKPFGASHPFLVARSLQDWFRREFTYSLEIPGGHGSSALERFLEERVGYCEQFAAAFVAMARSQGLASRVAVGYTPGVQRQPGRYIVQGRHAHAWPEVWFDGVGWVPFEPTPGRGVPGAEDHTGLPAQQDGPLGVLEPGSDDAAGFDALDEIGDLSDLDTGIQQGDALESSPLTEDGSPTSQNSLRHILAAVLFGLAVIVGVGPWVWRRVRSHQLHRLSTHQQVLTMWRRQLRALHRNGITSTKAMTVTEITRAAEQRIPALTLPVEGLSRCAVTAGFSPAPHFAPEVLEQCEAWDKEITQLLAQRKGSWGRVVSYFAVWRDRPVRADLSGIIQTGIIQTEHNRHRISTGNR